MTLHSRATSGGVLVCVFVSGLAGLGYEIVFARYLGLFLGHAGHAVIAVLAVFMGGTALGYTWLGARVDRSGNPLAFYGWLEIGIGLYALCFPALYSVCHEFFLRILRHTHPVAAGLVAFKFAFAGLTVLLPTVLMGGALPALVKFATHSLAELRERVAMLYSLNCLGAVVGCLAADFWWIPGFGLAVASSVIAGMNVAAGALALALSRASGWTPPGPTQALEQPDGDTTARGTGLRLVILGIGVSGFTAMLYEMAWTRMLSLALGSTTHAFSLMLAAFISGISAGAWLINRWKAAGHSLLAFAWTELCLGVTVSASLVFYGYLPYAFVSGANLLARDEAAYWLYVSWQGILCFCVMFFPAVCLGMTLPLATRATAGELTRSGRVVGRVFASNTVGAVIGAIVTGYWLMPALGLARTFGAGAAANLAVGLVLLADRKWPGKKTAYIVVPLLLIGQTWGIGHVFNDVWQRAFTLGLWRQPNAVGSFSEFKSVARDNVLKFYRDGTTATVSVNAWSQQGAEHLNLRVNGKPDASTAGDMPTQLLLGHLPLLLHSECQQALVIGLGSGITCGAIACQPSIQRLDAVEIAPEVVSAARLFAAHNHGVLEDPRFRLIIDDARSFLQITDRIYDVIVSEPSNPWVAGVAGIYTREFYEDCRGRLRPDGLMVQWLHLYDNSQEALDLVLRTFASVFPEVTLWQSEELDLILIGSVGPFMPDLAALAARFEEPAVRADLARIHLNRVSVLLARQIVSGQNGRFLARADGPLHTDSRPTLEYAAQRAFFVHREATQWLRFDENLSPRAGTLLAAYVATHPLTTEDYRAFAEFYRAYGLPRPELIRSLCHRWQSESPSSPDLIGLLTRLPPLGTPNELEALRLTPLRDELFKLAEKNPELLRHYAKLLLQIYREQRSIFYLPRGTELQAVLERLLATDPANRAVWQLQLAELAWDRGDTAGCIRWSQNAFDATTLSACAGNPEFAAALARLVDAFALAGNPRESAALCEAARRAGFHDSLLEMCCRRAIERLAHSAPRAQTP